MLLASTRVDSELLRMGTVERKQSVRFLDHLLIKQIDARATTKRPSELTVFQHSRVICSWQLWWSLEYLRGLLDGQLRAGSSRRRAIYLKFSWTKANQSKQEDCQYDRHALGNEGLAKMERLGSSQPIPKLYKARRKKKKLLKTGAPRLRLWIWAFLPHINTFDLPLMTHQVIPGRIVFHPPDAWMNPRVFCFFLCWLNFCVKGCEKKIRYSRVLNRGRVVLRFRRVFCGMLWEFLAQRMIWATSQATTVNGQRFGKRESPCRCGKTNEAWRIISAWESENGAWAHGRWVQLDSLGDMCSP
jgi:hypothetical protein